jgi:hypothetical protein
MLVLVVKLLFTWKDKAIELEGRAQHETGAERERLLAVADTLLACQADLKMALEDGAAVSNPSVGVRYHHNKESGTRPYGTIVPLRGKEQPKTILNTMKGRRVT